VLAKLQEKGNIREGYIPEIPDALVLSNARGEGFFDRPDIIMLIENVSGR